MGLISIGDVDIFDDKYVDPNYVEYRMSNTHLPDVLISVLETLEKKFPNGDPGFHMDLVYKLYTAVEENPNLDSYTVNSLNMESFYTTLTWVRND